MDVTANLSLGDPLEPARKATAEMLQNRERTFSLPTKPAKSSARHWNNGSDRFPTTPAGSGFVVITETGQLVDLARAAHFKQGVQWRQIGFAEQRGVIGLQGQFNGFPGVELVAVNAGDQAQGVRGQGPATQQKKITDNRKVNAQPVDRQYSNNSGHR